MNTEKDIEEGKDLLLDEVHAEQIQEHEENEGEIEALKRKIKELEDTYLRTHADFDNTKKRLEREKAQSLEYACENFAKELLPIMDSLEAAIHSVNGSSIDEALKQKFKEGLDLTVDNFNKVLERQGITPICANGEFDPHLHNAIMQNDSPDHKDGEIIQILQKGYQYKERVLRPALVNVCKK